MRYAIVIEKGKTIFPATYPIFRGVLPRAPQSKKRNRFFEKQSNFTLPAFAKTAPNPLSHPATSITSKLRRNRAIDSDARKRCALPCARHRKR